MNLLPNRKYKSGSKFCFWRWTYTPSGYITRFHLVMTPWFAVMLHWIHKPDQEPDTHDHPVTFLSIILRGGYTELRPISKEIVPANLVYPAKNENVWQALRHNWFNFIKASESVHHRILSVKPNTLTLCFVGPKTREWGFHTKDGWIHYKEYNKKYNNS